MSDDILKHYKEDTYDSYCEFLKKKYGEAPEDYFVVKPSVKKAHPRKRKLSYSDMKKNLRITRGNEGLYVHHIMEKEVDMLCDLDHCEIMDVPIGYHSAEQLVYCDLLEHLLLHILIEKDGYRDVGSSGGIFIFMGPELNDIYSGFTTSQAWKQKAYSLVKGQEKDYIDLIHAFINDFPNDLEPEIFCSSFNHIDKQDKRIYNLIRNIGEIK